MIPTAPFRLERYMARHEFRAPYVLCASDCEPLTMAELLAMADDETLALWRDLRLSYTDSQGHPLLRAEIAALYPGVAADDVLVLAPEEGILVGLQALLTGLQPALAPGDQVVATHPAYQSLHEVARACGATVRAWAPRGEADGWRFSVADLEALLTPDTRLLVTNFPHNPTGALPTPGEWRRMLSLAEARGIPVFSDEMYRGLERDEAETLPSAGAMCERALSLGGLSKAFGLPGLRLGWLATRDRALMARCCGLRDYTTICTSAPSEILALMALRARRAILSRNRAIIAENLGTLTAFAGERPDLLTWIAPRAGSVALARLPVDDVDHYCEALVERAGVLLLPASVFGWPGPHVRLGYGRRHLAEGLARWAEDETA